MKLRGQTYTLTLGDLGRVRCEPGWHLGPDWVRGLRDYDLWFVWAGRGRMRVGRDEVRLGPGSCVWMRPGQAYEAEQEPAERLGVNYIHFQLHRAGRALPLSAFSPPFEVMHTRQPDLVDAMMRRVIELRGEGGEEVAGALLAALLMELAREQAEAPGAEPAGLDQHHRELVLHAAARIREDPGRVPAIAALARRAGYSVDHFSRVFLKITGARPQDYVITARIERARQLLTESNLSVGMIAEALGFRDIFYFSRQFRQRTGQTPTEFRRGRRWI
jgi:AraC-like DNA-binding protein